MQTVSIGELKNQISGHLQHVKNGEGIVILDRDVPVARMPFRYGSGGDREAKLVASGAMKMPEQEMDWDRFFRAPAANLSLELAVEAAIESRGNR